MLTLLWLFAIIAYIFIGRVIFLCCLARHKQKYSCRMTEEEMWNTGGLCCIWLPTGVIYCVVFWPIGHVLRLSDIACVKITAALFSEEENHDCS